MPIKKFLSMSEATQFDSYPRLTYSQREHFFNKYGRDPKLVKIMKSMPEESQVNFLVTLVYFKMENKFFYERSIKDRNYARKNLNIDCNQTTVYPRRTYSRHKTKILNVFGIKEFSNEAVVEISKITKHLFESQIRLKLIFGKVVEYLKANKIEIPTSATLQKVISDEARAFDNRLLKRFENPNADVYLSLSNLFFKRAKSKDSRKKYHVANFKEFSHSRGFKKVSENAKLFLELKDKYENCRIELERSELDDNGIAHLAYIFKTSDVYQFKKMDYSRRYLYLCCFIVFQYKYFQDHFIQLFQNLISTENNRESREEKDFIYGLYRDKDLARIKINKNYHQIALKMNKALEEISESENIEKLRFVDVGFPELVSEMNSYIEFENKVKRIKEDYTKSHYVSMENEIRRALRKIESFFYDLDIEFTKKNSKLARAYRFLVETDGKIIHPYIKFLKIEDQKHIIIKNGCLYNPYLYKYFLFTYMSRSIKSGEISFNNSNEFKNLREHLIPKDEWIKTRVEVLKKLELPSRGDINRILGDLKEELDSRYFSLNEKIIKGDVEKLRISETGRVIVSTPGVDNFEDRYALLQYLPQDQYVSLIDVLRTVNEATGFTSHLNHHQLRKPKSNPSIESYLAAIIGIGCHIGPRKICRISKNIESAEVENIVKWHLHPDHLYKANDAIINFLNTLSLPQVYRRNPSDLHTSSDGQKWPVAVDSVHARPSYKYFGQREGVVVNTHVDERFIAFYSKTIMSTDREAASVIDGLLHNDLIKSTIHSTDTHGYTEALFAVMTLLGYEFAPRIKNVAEQSLYSFDSPSEFKKLAIGPNKKINIQKIKNSWDKILQLLASLKSKQTKASTLFKKLNSYTKDQEVYGALKELGKVYKSLFILKYFENLEYRQSIEKQLNKAEFSNRFSKIISFGNGGEVSTGALEEMEVIEGCKRLIKNSIVCWNYLYFSQLLLKRKKGFEREDLLHAISRESMVKWRHINFHGEYDFSKKKSRESIPFQLTEITKMRLK